jgi:hypothetical protein
MRVRMPSVMWCVKRQKKEKEKSSLYEENAWRDEMRMTDSCAVKIFLPY